MNGYYKVMLGLLLLFASSSLSAQAVAALNTAISNNFNIGNVFGGTPVLVPVGGVGKNTVEECLRNVQAELNGNAIGAQQIDTNNFGGWIRWGHEVTPVASAGIGEIVVATGANGNPGGNATANNTHAGGSAYATGGQGVGGGGNAAGGTATANAGGSDDTVAEAYGGDGIGAGNGGTAAANGSSAGGSSRGTAIAEGGDTFSGTAGDALAVGDGDTTATGGNGNTGQASDGGSAVATTINGANLSPGTIATANGGIGGNTSGTPTANGPNTGPGLPGAPGSTSNAS